VASRGLFNVDSTTPEPQAEKLNRVELLRRAWAMFESFLTAHPDDPAADQAALADAGVLLDLKAYKDAAAACDLYAKRYPKSELLDAYWYVIGYCHFADGRHEAAIEMCRKVAEMKRIDPATGREEESRNKWQAIYILGQVYHSLGEAADAIGAEIGHALHDSALGLAVWASVHGLAMLILENVIDLGQRRSGLDVLPSRAEILLRSLFSVTRD